MPLQNIESELINAQSLLRSHLKKIAPLCFAISQCSDDDLSSPEIVEAAIAILKVFNNDPDVIEQTKKCFRNVTG
jgi:hypothetical protein